MIMMPYAGAGNRCSSQARQASGTPQVYLSTHTVAFHLRHVFWKLGVTSCVQLARMAAEQTVRISADV